MRAVTAAHHQLPGGNIVLVWDNLNVHLKTELRAFTTAQPWLRVFQLPPYAPDLNPLGDVVASVRAASSPAAPFSSTSAKYYGPRISFSSTRAGRSTPRRSGSMFSPSG